MKSMKKLLSLVLAMMLVLAMGSTAMAAPEDEANAGTGKITIDNAIPSTEASEGVEAKTVTYTIYEMFKLESYDSATNAYLYTVKEDWKDFVAENGTGSAYVGVNDDGYVVWKNTDTGNNTDVTKAFAAAAAQYIEDKGLSGITQKAPVGPADGTVSVEFTELELGYYLVGSTSGVLCSLDTTNPDVVIKDKNEKPVIEKEIKQPTVSIGEKVDYEIRVSVASYPAKYVVHDKMNAGLSFGVAEDGTVLGEVTGITVLPQGAAEGETGTAATEGIDYTVKTEGLTDGCDFEVIFSDDFCNSLVQGSTILVKYTATVNENATLVVEADKDNPLKNEAHLQYGPNGEFTTTPDEATPKIFDLEINKIDGRNRKALAGAEFSLSRVDTPATEGVDETTVGVTFEKPEGETYYQVTGTGEATILAVDENGKLELKGLAAGTYYLTETKAPDGYNILKEPVKIVIDEDGNVKVSSKTLNDDGTYGDEAMSDVTGAVIVENNTGVELPSTGGIGTTIFYVLGGILVVGAGILLVVKKRMSSEK